MSTKQNTGVVLFVIAILGIVIGVLMRKKINQKFLFGLQVFMVILLIVSIALLASKTKPKKYRCDEKKGCMEDPKGTLNDCSSCKKVDVVGYDPDTNSCKLKSVYTTKNGLSNRLNAVDCENSYVKKVCSPDKGCIPDESGKVNCSDSCYPHKNVFIWNADLKRCDPIPDYWSSSKDLRAGEYTAEQCNAKVQQQASLKSCDRQRGCVTDTNGSQGCEQNCHQVFDMIYDSPSDSCKKSYYYTDQKKNGDTDEQKCINENVKGRFCDDKLGCIPKSDPTGMNTNCDSCFKHINYVADQQQKTCVPQVYYNNTSDSSGDQNQVECLSTFASDNTIQKSTCTLNGCMLDALGKFETKDCASKCFLHPDVYVLTKNYGTGKPECRQLPIYYSESPDLNREAGEMTFSECQIALDKILPRKS